MGFEDNNPHRNDDNHDDIIDKGPGGRQLVRSLGAADVCDRLVCTSWRKSPVAACQVLRGEHVSLMLLDILENIETAGPQM